MKDRSKIIEYQSCWYDIQGNHLEHCLSFEQNKEKQKLLRKQKKIRKAKMNKQKKYQYLYLEEKLNSWVGEETLYDIGHGSFLPKYNRIGFYLNWLYRINKKYDYIR